MIILIFDASLDLVNVLCSVVVYPHCDVDWFILFIPGVSLLTYLSFSSLAKVAHC